jgi:hypothetical protein
MTGTLVAMMREDGGADSELHLGGGIIAKPDENGVVLVPSEFVLALLNAGYVWPALIRNTVTRDPAPTINR